MSIDASELKYFESLDVDSLGGDISGTVVSSAIDLFFNGVPETEAIVGSVKYRCFFVKNESLEILAAANVYISGTTPSPSTHVQLGLGTAGMNLAEQSITSEDVEPVDVIFTGPTQEDPIPIGDMNPGDYHAVWIKRVVEAEAVGVNTDSVTLGFAGDQPPAP